MKKMVFFLAVVFLFFGCGNATKKQQEAEQAKVVLTVDELYEQAAELSDKEVVVKGTVYHVCKEGGARCFLMGSNENINIRVEAGEKIGAFTQEQMGSELEISGILKVVRTEAEAHNPAKEHGTEGEPGDSLADAAHEVISAAIDSAEVVYFIEGLAVKEVPAATENQ
ncbi:MAG: hypothetical protein AB7S72_08995 [Draconibacterium sp.]